MIGCLRTRVRKQPIIALYFESENELKFMTSRPGFDYQFVMSKVEITLIIPARILRAIRKFVDRHLL